MGDAYEARQLCSAFPPARAFLPLREVLGDFLNHEK